MSKSRRTSSDQPEAIQERGQVLVLFALMLIVLLGMAALAIDVSRNYSLRRYERSVADAAALAGAQDLQSRLSPDYPQARIDALRSLQNQLGPIAGGASCPTTSNILNCPLGDTPYLVSITTPSPSCSTCDPEHSVQVTVRDATFETAFAGILGQPTWDISQTSVAGLTFSAQYAVITLRPPNPLPNGLDQNRQDIDVDGTNTLLKVFNGDIGTNTSAFTNSGSMITLEPSFRIYHIDDINPDPWNKILGNPQGKLIKNLIPDPAYRYPVRTGLSTYTTQAAGVDAGCLNAPTGADKPPAAAVCYNPGIYTQVFKDNQNTDIEFLDSGVYFFDGGVDISGSLLGGTVAGQPGVAVVVPEGNTTFKANNAAQISLNAGPALAASDANGELKTPQGLVLTVFVGPKDAACFDGTTPLLCSDNQNQAIFLAAGKLAVGGVIYAPSSFVQISSNYATQTGTVGQIVSWDYKFSGGSQLNQEYPGTPSKGLMRLDAACTAPGEPCNSP